MQGIKASGAERGSLLEWRWTPFFALLTLALVMSLITALVVPSTPAQLFAAPEVTRLSKRAGIPTQTGLSEKLSLEDSDDSSESTKSLSSGNTRRGSLQRLADRNRTLNARPAPPVRQPSLPVRREIPPPPEPETRQFSNDRAVEDEEPAEQVDEAEEEVDEAPAPQGSGGSSGQDEDAPEDEDGAPAPSERPRLLNPGVLRAIPGLQR
ncbi:MAG: hypothetical protein R3B89_08670 [Polyangiaceae bacterium]